MQNSLNQTLSKSQQEDDEALRLIGQSYHFGWSRLIIINDIPTLLNDETKVMDVTFKDLEGDTLYRIPSPSGGWKLQSLAAIVDIYTKNLYADGFDAFLGEKEILSSEY